MPNYKLPKFEYTDTPEVDHEGMRKCGNCGQRIKTIIKDKHSRIVPHNRKVFRGMKNGRPDWVIEVCSGGSVE